MFGINKEHPVLLIFIPVQFLIFLFHEASERFLRIENVLNVDIPSPLSPLTLPPPRSASPGSQAVSKRWSVGWDSYLASKLGYVIVTMDVTGSGARGDTCRKGIHRRLGSIETEDILAVVR